MFTVWFGYLVFRFGYKFINVWVRHWAEEILRMEWKCSPVRRLLCDVLYSPTGAAWFEKGSVYRSVMIQPQPWSCRLSALRWLVMSYRKATSQKRFILELCCVFSFASHELTYLLMQLETSFCCTFSWLSHSISAWQGQSPYSELNPSRKNLNDKWTVLV